MTLEQQEEMHEKARKELTELIGREIKNEAQLENYFCRKVKEAGAIVIKFTSMSATGLPDDIVFYKGFVWLVELKTPKGTIQPHQLHMHDRFKKQGFKVRIIRTKQEVLKFIDQMLNLEW